MSGGFVVHNIKDKKVEPGGQYRFEFWKSLKTKKWHGRIVSVANGQTVLSTEANGIANKKDLMATLKPLAKMTGANALLEELSPSE